MIAMSEGGTGWIPYALERMDYTFSHHKAWTGADFGGLTPRDAAEPRVEVECCEVDMDLPGYRSTLSTARNASCGTSTVPICFMRFLPSFCFSSSLRLRVMSPP